MQPHDQPADSRPISTTLTPLRAADVDLAAGWMRARENHQWLDFGSGRQVLSGRALAAMTRSSRHLLRLFVPVGSTSPVGIVGIADLDPTGGTASIWFVLGDKTRYGQGLTTCAVGQVLTLAFERYRLASVHAWTVEHNLAARRVLERNGFQLVGRRRRSHTIDGCRLDRLLFDVVEEELVHRPALVARESKKSKESKEPNDARHTTELERA